jgi:hypothetical protein
MLSFSQWYEPCQKDWNKRRVIRGDDRERQARGTVLFGHLCLYNRLNVSMSRQKKLLVVVGDAGSLQNPLAADFVPGTSGFSSTLSE